LKQCVYVCYNVVLLGPDVYRSFVRRYIPFMVNKLHLHY